MSEDRIRWLAQTLLRLDQQQLRRLAELLQEEGGDQAAVGALLPHDPRPREGGAEAPFEDWPAEYWESQA